MSWEKTAQVIAGKLKNGARSDQRIRIRMLSCHGAEATQYANALPGNIGRGFTEAMADHSSKEGFKAFIVSYNDPVVSWGRHSPASLKAGEGYNQWEATFKQNVSNNIEQEFSLALQENPRMTYPERLEFMRERGSHYNIEEIIAQALQRGNLVHNNPVAALANPVVEQGEQVV